MKIIVNLSHLKEKLREENKKFKLKKNKFKTFSL